MTVNESLRRRVTQLRKDSPYPMGIFQAVQIARYEARDWSESEFPFLAKLQNGSESVTGDVGPFEVHVHIEPDYDSRIGEDDVTGTFHERTRGYYGDDEYSKPDPNAVRCSYAGYNGPRDVYWYVPGNATLELRDYYIKEDRKSRALIEDIVRATIKQDMRNDADRAYYGVVVNVFLDGEEMGSASLWGIDTIDSMPAAPYFCDTASELIGEALQQAHDQLPVAAETAATHAAKIRAAIVSA